MIEIKPDHLEGDCLEALTKFVREIRVDSVESDNGRNKDLTVRKISVICGSNAPHGLNSWASEPGYYLHVSRIEE